LRRRFPDIACTGKYLKRQEIDAQHPDPVNAAVPASASDLDLEESGLAQKALR